MDSTGPRPPTFVKGYPNGAAQQYMNLGYLTSPYPGKTGQGDYGPSQGGEAFYVNTKGKPMPRDTKEWAEWHNPWNPTQYIPLDFSKAVSRVAHIQGSYSDNIPLYLQNADRARQKVGHVRQ